MTEVTEWNPSDLKYLESAKCSTDYIERCMLLTVGKIGGGGEKHQ
jgi:hypothetical protein